MDAYIGCSLTEHMRRPSSLYVTEMDVRGDVDEHPRLGYRELRLEF